MGRRYGDVLKRLLTFSFPFAFFNPPFGDFFRPCWPNSYMKEGIAIERDIDNETGIDMDIGTGIDMDIENGMDIDRRVGAFVTT